MRSLLSLTFMGILTTALLGCVEGTSPYYTEVTRTSYYTDVTPASQNNYYTTVQSAPPPRWEKPHHHHHHPIPVPAAPMPPPPQDNGYHTDVTSPPSPSNDYHTDVTPAPSAPAGYSSSTGAPIPSHSAPSQEGSSDQSGMGQQESSGYSTTTTPSS